MKLRPMTIEDAPIMYRLKNDPLTRQFAIISKEEIPYEHHLEWLKKNVHKFQIIEGMPEDQNSILGAIRIDDNEISIWVEKEFRNQRIAEGAINKVSSYGMKARIVDGNVASMRAFIRAGFLPIEHIENYYILQK